MNQIRRFLGYIIFRIYRHGIRLMKIGGEDWEWGGYFYFLGIPAIFTSFISYTIFRNITGINIDDYVQTDKAKLPIFLLIALLNMYIISLFIPFNYVKNLTYTPEERVKYRNVFLVLLGIFVLFVLLRIKGFL